MVASDKETYELHYFQISQDEDESESEDQMTPSFIGLCLLIKQIKHTKETSWNGPLAYLWIKNITLYVKHPSLLFKSMLFIWCWLSFNTFLYFYWSVADLQCCVSFRCTVKWMSLYIYPLFVIQTITEYWVGFSVLHSSFLLTCFMYAKSLQSCLTLCKTVDYSPPGFSVHGILQARILEWVAVSYCFMYSNMYMSVSISQCIPLSCIPW